MTRARGVILDVDGTLYSGDSACAGALRERHREVFISTTGLNGDEGLREFQRLTARHGIALIGAALANGRDVAETLAAAHDIDHPRLLQPSPQLRDALRAVPGTVIAWSNATTAHVGAVLRALGIDDLVMEVAAIEAFVTSPKPSDDTFAAALGLLQCRPEEAVLFEDSASTLQRARERGMATVGIGPGADYPDIVTALRARRVRALLGISAGASREDAP